MTHHACIAPSCCSLNYTLLYACADTCAHACVDVRLQHAITNESSATKGMRLNAVSAEDSKLFAAAY
jgi:hypothetical protein